MSKIEDISAIRNSGVRVMDFETDGKPGIITLTLGGYCSEYGNGWAYQIDTGDGERYSHQGQTKQHPELFALYQALIRQDELTNQAIITYSVELEIVTNNNWMIDILSSGNAINLNRTSGLTVVGNRIVHFGNLIDMIYIELVSKNYKFVHTRDLHCKKYFDDCVSTATSEVMKFY